MKPIMIILDFKDFKCKAELFDSEISRSFIKHLPLSIDLIEWGNELYGTIGIDLGKENPIPTIPKGGIAYSQQGTYICIFYGQTPAWPVDYIGRILGEDRDKLFTEKAPGSVRIEFA